MCRRFHEIVDSCPEVIYVIELGIAGLEVMNGSDGETNMERVAAVTKLCTAWKQLAPHYTPAVASLLARTPRVYGNVFTHGAHITIPHAHSLWCDSVQMQLFVFDVDGCSVSYKQHRVPVCFISYAISPIDGVGIILTCRELTLDIANFLCVNPTVHGCLIA